MRFRAAAIFVLLLIGGGCAHFAGPSQVNLADTSPALAPTPDAKALLSLDQISIPATQPSIPPATQPDALPPVRAVALFAAARDELLDNRPQAACDLLEQAIALDPRSFELYRALGEARLAAIHHTNPQEMDAFEKALALRPDELRLQALMGAQYTALGDYTKALRHLRQATHTHDYADDDVAAAAVDLLLARLLQEEEYDRAALDEYLVLLDRLNNPSYALRSDPELGPLSDHPETVWLEIGFLHEKHGEWADALAVYQPLAAADGASFDLQAKVVRMLANLGRTREALGAAARIVMQFSASTQTMDLLREVCRHRNIDTAAALATLRQSHPNDLSLLLAQAQILSDDGHIAEAQSLLEPVATSVGRTGDTDDQRRIVDKLFDLYLHNDDISAAARLLVVDLAAHPDSLGELEDWWEELLSPSRSNTLHLATLQRLQVDDSAQAARLFLVWRLADMWQRYALARDSLQKAVLLTPAFAPAFRQLVMEELAREDWDAAQKRKASLDLAELARKDGNLPLAAEISGLAALSDQHPGESVADFEQALALGGSSAQLLLTYAAALRAEKQDLKAEQTLWKLVNTQPHYEDAWEALYQFYHDQQSAESKPAARQVLSQWLAANPASVVARIMQADQASGDGNVQEAQTILLRLFADHDDDPAVLSALVSLGQRTGRLDDFVQRLEAVRHREPADTTAVQWLVDIYASQGRMADAARVLDETRKAVAQDADALYRLSHLYERVDQPATTEAVLQQAVAVDPNEASACNDLGYTWADQGRNLDRAESLIRVAVAQEPDNESFLDSLGWVLYKRGRYAQAAGYFRQAIGPASQPDPVVLDHFGDVLYRMGRGDEAAQIWRRSLARLDAAAANPDDMHDLRQALERKLTESSLGKPVGVAPVPEK